MVTREQLNERGAGFLPGLLGLEIMEVEPGRVIALFRCTQLILYPR